jgi:3-phenylpropionate/trans-cinnamate dioxygenase ferredoxin subunit
MVRHVIRPVSELPPGERLVTEVAGRKIVIFNLGGEFFGLFNRCPHQGGDLCEGRTIGLLRRAASRAIIATRGKSEILRCPWHGWEFDIRTGKSCSEPNRIHTPAYPVASVPGRDRGAATASRNGARQRRSGLHRR